MRANILSISLSDLQLAITKGIKEDLEFQSYCNSVLGEQLNYYVESNISIEYEGYNHFVCNKSENGSSSVEGEEDEWELELFIFTEGERQSVTQNDIEVYESSSISEKLMIEAVKAGIRSLSATNEYCQLRMTGINIQTTEIGESNDMCSAAFLRFNQEKTLN